MVFPIQSVFAAALLLTLAFTVNDRSPVPAPSDPAIQLACDHEDGYPVPGTVDGSTAVSGCGSASAR